MPTLWLQLLRTPGLTGALLPSSRHLAQAMARTAGDAQHIVELGAGTGALTTALRRKLPQASLIAVEIQPLLAQQLRSTFAGLDVREEAAHAVLSQLTYSSQAAVVSSLPFRSLPQPLREATQASIEDFLRRVPGSRLIQFTYLPRAPFAATADFQWHRACVVWRNLPPAGVWVLQHQPCLGPP